MSKDQASPKGAILVTGGSGFIGRHTVESLISEGYAVRAFIRRGLFWPEWENVQQVTGDLTDPDAVNEAVKGSTAIVHLAAATSETPSRMAESLAVNVGGAENLIRACKRQNVKRVVVISSQSTKRKDRGPYGESKREADRLFLTSGLDVTVLKLTLVYGPGGKGVFSKVNKLVQGLPIVPVIGSGEYKLQPVWVGDVVAAILACLKTSTTIGHVYDIAGADRLTFNQFVDALSVSETGFPKSKLHVPYHLALWAARLAAALPNPPLTRDNVIGVVQETKIDLEPARRDFGFAPVKLSQGLRLGQEHAPNKRCDALRVVVIGMGKMGLVHASIINALPQGRLVGVMDTKHSLRTFVRSWGIRAPFYSDTTTLLDESRPQVAIVSIPPAFTRQVVEECLKRDIHVLVEKPLANSLSNARAIAELATTRQSVVSVGFMVAFHSTFSHARWLLQQGTIGQFRAVRAHAFQSQVFSAKKGWRFDEALSGGGVLPLVASHSLFLLYWYFGQPQSVEAEVRSLYSKVDDEASVRLTFASGLQAQLETSWSRPGYLDMMQSIEVTGENGQMRVTSDRIELRLEQPWSGCPAGDSLIHRSTLLDGDQEIGAQGYYAQDSAFINSILSGEPLRVNLDGGLAVQRMLEAIYRAGKTGEPVELQEVR